jgi:hypothetical protein
MGKRSRIGQDKFCVLQRFGNHEDAARRLDWQLTLRTVEGYCVNVNAGGLSRHLPQDLRGQTDYRNRKARKLRQDVHAGERLKQDPPPTILAAHRQSVTFKIYRAHIVNGHLVSYTRPAETKTHLQTPQSVAITSFLTLVVSPPPPFHFLRKPVFSTPL